jgi:hypothetical protein
MVVWRSSVVEGSAFAEACRLSLPNSRRFLLAVRDNVDVDMLNLLLSELNGFGLINTERFIGLGL